jgi:hypothetical protein
MIASDIRFRARAPEVLVELAQALDRALQDRDLGLQAQRDARRLGAHDSPADHDDACRLDSGHAAYQQAGAAPAALREVGARLGGEPARDLAHRR